MKLVAPVIDKKVTANDYSIEYLGSAYNDFYDFSSFANKPTGEWAWGNQAVEVQGLFSPFDYADDIGRFTMNVTLPSETLPNGTIVYQYMQMQNLYDEESELITMGCRYTVGKNSSEVVEAFRGEKGLARMDENTVAGKKVSEQNKATQVPVTEAFFQKNLLGQNETYATISTEWGETIQPCIVDMRIPRDAPHALAESDAWFAIIGARLYTSITDPNFVQLPEFNTTWMFEESNPEDINDPELEALFKIDEAEENLDELWDEYAALLAELDIAMKVLEELKEEAIFDATDNANYADADVAALYTDVKASQSINTAYKVVPEVNMPDQLEFIFTADIPNIALVDGSVIYQFLELTEGSDTIAVECKVSVGNPDGVKTSVLSGAGLDKASGAGKTWSELATTPDAELKASHNFGQEYFKLKASKTDLTNNQVQNCKVAIDVPKSYTKDLFRTWSVLLGVRVYDSETATKFINLYESAPGKTLKIEKIAIKNKPVAASTYENVEIDEKEAASETGAAAANDLTALGVA